MLPDEFVDLMLMYSIRLVESVESRREVFVSYFNCRGDWPKQFLKDVVLSSVHADITNTACEIGSSFQKSTVEQTDAWNEAVEHGDSDNNYLWPWPDSMRPGEDLFSKATVVAGHKACRDLKDVSCAVFWLRRVSRPGV